MHASGLGMERLLRAICSLKACHFDTALNDASGGSHADSQLFRDRTPGITRRAHGFNPGMTSKNARSAEVFAFRPSVAKPSLHSLPDQLAFKLRHGSDDL